jgi:hypothetical protein
MTGMIAQIMEEFLTKVKPDFDKRHADLMNEFKSLKTALSNLEGRLAKIESCLKTPEQRK